MDGLLTDESVDNCAWVVQSLGQDHPQTHRVTSAESSAESASLGEMCQCQSASFCL